MRCFGRFGWLVVALVAAGTVLLAASTAAHAVCAPDPATSGQTVTCTGNDADGFLAGGGVDNLTVNVQPGATVADNGNVAIGVNDGNTLTLRGAITAANTLTGVSAVNNNSIVNSGSVVVGTSGTGIAVADNNNITNNAGVTGGSGSTGIFAGIGNTIVNSATGALTLGNNGVGVFVAGSSTVSNFGGITIGNSGGFSGGIVAINDDNTVMNAAGASIAVGTNNLGILVQGNNARIANAGGITAAAGGVGIFVQGNNANIASSGTIAGGLGSAGIFFQGDNSVLTSTGAITGGAANSVGFAVAGNMNAVTNAGTLALGDTGTGILVFGDSNIIINSGAIDVGAMGIGIDATTFTPGALNSIINTGNIKVGAGGTGILVSNDGTVFNAGTIDAATGAFAIDFCLCSPASSLTLATTSVINGLVRGAGNTVFQLGGAGGTGTFNLSDIGVGQQYDGFVTFNKIDTSHWILTGIGNQDWNIFGGMLTLNGIINGQIAINNGAFVANGTVNGGVNVNGGSLVANGTVNGAVNVNGGSLVSNGVVNGVVSINGGGVLGGNGTVGSTTINVGTLSPGNSIGTITVNGNLVLSSAAAYLVEFDAVSSDLTNVTGTATVAGTVQAVFANGPLLRRYTILTANGGVSGTFATLTNVNLPAGFAPTLTYDANNVYLSLTAALGGGLPQNQQNVANSLNTFFNGGGALPARFFELFKLTGASLAGTLNQVTGEVATQASQAAFTSVDYFLNLMLDPFVSGRGGDVSSSGPGANQYALEDPDAYAARRKGRTPAEQDAYAAVYRKAVARNNVFDPRWSVWGAAYGGEVKSEGNLAVIGSRDASSRAFGFAAGADYRLSRDTLVGFALSGGGTNFSLAQGGGSGRSDVFQAGAFVRHNFGQGYIKGAIAYGWHDVTTDRIVAIAGLDRLEGRYNANSFGARAEAGYRFLTPFMGVGLTPYAAGQAITYFLPAYGEQATLGVNAFALNYASRDVTTVRSEIGVRADKSFALQSALMTLRSRAAWAHYFDESRALTANFQTFAAPAFVVTGADQARNTALVSASADLKWMNGISIAGVFEGEFSGQTRGYAGKGIARYQW
jgi:uncharacterized protein with beta-barrel porin domain